MEEFLHSLHPYVVGLLIGFIIGLERERAHQPESQAMGVRTFSFIGLLGTFAALLDSELIATALALFVFSGILLGYLRSTHRRENADIGLTTEVAAAVVFCLGYIGAKDRTMAFMLVALTLLLLMGRKAIHNFTREKITQQEAEAFVTLIVLAVAILPFLSREPIDPWGVFVPFRLGALVFLLAVVQFSSYALLKIFGERVGAPLGGFLAGMASSTAAFVNVREQLNEQERGFRWDVLAYGMMATAASAIQSVVIIFATSPVLARSMLWCFGLVILVCFVFSTLGFVRSKEMPMKSPEENSGPLNIKKQLAFASVLFVVMALANLAKKFWGDTAFLAVSFVSGLFELQGVTFAISSMEFSENVMWAMALAFIASLVSKASILMSIRHANIKVRGVWLGALVLLAICFLIPLLFLKNLGQLK